MRIPVLVVLAVSVALASCGVPTEGSAEIADAEQVPFGLLNEDRQPVTGANPSGQVMIRIYLYADDQDALVPVARRVERANLSTVFEELDRGPTDAESAANLRSPLADVDAVEDAEVDAGVATVDLAEAFSDIRSSDQLIAIAQLVFTITDRPGIGQVSFTLDGQPVEIPRGDGTLTSGIVSRDDYSSLAPPT